MKSQGEFLQYLQQIDALSAQKAAEALRIWQESERELEDVLADYLPAQTLERHLADFFQMPAVDWRELDEGLWGVLPRSLILRYGILPYKKAAGVLYMAISQRPSAELLADLSLFTKWPLAFGYAPEKVIEERIFALLAKGYDDEVYYGPQIYDIDGVFHSDGEAAELILYRILIKALDLNASDVHLEIFDGEVQIRLRIDGFLHRFWHLPAGLYSALVNVIKIKADMDIAMRLKPQDGHFRIRHNQAVVDIRVATLPCLYGEKVVLRLLGARPELLALESLGFEEENLQKIKKVLAAPYGLILLTGPTNSGKSTTLYGMLGALLGHGKNIMTIEDPVEYELQGINQVQINEKSQLTFAKGLRGILRQDPDIIMIGELRDAETAEIAIRAANTGHLVMASLHTNDAFSAVLRLLEMGIEPFLLTNALLAVAAQRLVRRNCPYCAQAETITIDGEAVTAYRGRGCAYCHDLGYKGRLALQEVWLPQEEERQAILRAVDIAALRRQALARGFVDIWHDGVEKLKQGLTTYEEIRLVKP